MIVRKSLSVIVAVRRYWASSKPRGATICALGTQRPSRVLLTSFRATRSATTSFARPFPLTCSAKRSNEPDLPFQVSGFGRPNWSTKLFSRCQRLHKSANCVIGLGRLLGFCAPRLYPLEMESRICFSASDFDMPDERKISQIAVIAAVSTDAFFCLSTTAHPRVDLTMHVIRAHKHLHRPCDAICGDAAHEAWGDSQSNRQPALQWSVQETDR
jgi:hypothetical protein